MKLQLISFLVIIPLFHQISPIGANQYIGDCHYYDEIVGKCNLTLICVAKPQSTTLLNPNVKSICRNQHLYRRYTDGFSKYWIGTINFQDCQQLEIPANFFTIYDRIHTFDMSRMGVDSLNSGNFTNARRLTKLIASHNQIVEIPANLLNQSTKLTHLDFSFNQIHKIDSQILPADNHVEFFDVSFNNLTEFDVNTFQQFNKLTQLIASHNQIAEIPSFLFHKTEKLAIIDFSFNRIECIDNFAFSGDLNLKQLNLSHNQLNALHRKIVDNFMNLTKLDVSWNQITNLTASDLFDSLENLIYLDVSGNPLKSLNNNRTFGALRNLQQLFLSQTSLRTIGSGTFSGLKNLRMLDLSGNQLIQLNIDIFGVRSEKLKWLSVAENRLRELNGFTSASIPNAKIIGIDRNRFNCTYFEQIFANITWKHLDSISKRINCSATIEIDTDDSGDVDRFQCVAANLMQNSSMVSGKFIAMTMFNVICLSIFALVLIWRTIRKQLLVKYRFVDIIYCRKGGSEPLTNDIEIGE